MEHGNADHRSRVRLKKPFDNKFIATSSALGSLVVALFVAACGGGGSLPDQTRQLSPQYKNCIGNPGLSAAAHQDVSIRPTIGTCPSPPPMWDVIVDNPGNNTATSYQFATTGNATPLATMTSTANQLKGNYGIWFDGDTGDFFIANIGTNTVNRYNLSCLTAGTHSGCPDQTLFGTGLNAPYAATENYWNVLPQGDEPAYTLDKSTPSIVSQLENQSGTVTPLFTIAGGNTLLADGQGLAVDGNSPSISPNSGAIYADAYTAATVMMWAQPSPWPTQGAVLNIAPTKKISGANTGITHPMGLYVDASGYVYVVNRNPDKIIVFSPTASGNATPSNTITNAAITSPYGVSVYTDGTVYVTNDGGTYPSITSFNNGEHGPSSLQHNISGSNTGLNNPANLDVRISR